MSIWVPSPTLLSINDFSTDLPMSKFLYGHSIPFDYTRMPDFSCAVFYILFRS